MHCKYHRNGGKKGRGKEGEMEKVKENEGREEGKQKREESSA